MSNEKAIITLREQGFRITKQRKLILDIILKNDGSTCKDIYYQVISKDNTIGAATVYRMIRLLEDLGIIERIDMITVKE
ncbi:Fur family transcriptional regulator [Butyrivibrio sp. VCD2006]|uniref:Fur family transcriptional regulator n=1 Tax=Butyrivibrio sp. VCD2006 TaxID=1280664 RepID=UPI0003F73FA3|nr:transcriptional repressor [Butyrivibrio sp. VCD2006]